MLEYDFGNFYNGSRNTLQFSGRLAPVPQAALTIDYEYNDINSVGIDAMDLSTHLVTVGSRFALNPRIQLSTLYQYNSFDEQGRWNLRFSWEYQPLSFIYIVYNNSENNDFLESNRNQQVISKVTLIKQF